MTIDEIVNYVMYTSHNTNPAVLRDLLNSVEGSGSLPSVSSTDNGKVLTVVEGAWAAAKADGGTVFVHFTVNPQTFQLEADKTFAECVAESAKMMHQMPLVAECFGVIGPLFQSVIDGSVVSFTWTAPRPDINKAGSDLAGWSWEFGGVYFVTVLYTADGIVVRGNDYINATAGGGALVVTMISSGSIDNLTLTTDKTTAEIFAALPSVYFVLSLEEGSTAKLDFTDWNTGSGTWNINFVQQTTTFQLSSESADAPMSGTIVF